MGMSFQEFVKEKERMCGGYANCDECGLSEYDECDDFCFDQPEQAEEIVQRWIKDNPPITNADKFKEVFGVSVHKVMGCGDWWSKVYTEPVEQDS